MGQRGKIWKPLEVSENGLRPETAILIEMQ